MLKRQRETGANGIYGLVAEVIEAPEPYEKALTAVLGQARPSTLKTAWMPIPLASQCQLPARLLSCHSQRHA